MYFSVNPYCADLQRPTIFQDEVDGLEWCSGRALGDDVRRGKYGSSKRGRQAIKALPPDIPTIRDFQVSDLTEEGVRKVGRKRINE